LELQEQDGLWSVIRHFEQVIALAHLRFSEDTDSPTVQDKTVARTGLPVPDLPDTSTSIKNYIIPAGQWDRW